MSAFSAQPTGERREVFRAAHMSINAGTKLGRYEVQTLLGTGRPPRQLPNFKTENLSRFAAAPDGKHFALARGETTDDVVLIKDFR